MDFCFHISSWLIIWLLLIPQIRGGYFSSVSLWRFWHMCLRVLFSLPCFHFFKIIFLWLLSICQSFLKLISLLCWAFSVEACLSGTLCPSFCTPYPWCWFCCCLSPTPCPSLRTRSRLEVQAPVLVDVEDNADMLPGLGALCFLLLLQTSGFITAVTPAAFTEAFSISPTGRVCFVWLLWFSAMSLALNYLCPPARWLPPAAFECWFHARLLPVSEPESCGFSPYCQPGVPCILFDSLVCEHDWLTSSLNSHSLLSSLPFQK